MINILLTEGCSTQCDLIKNIKAADFFNRTNVFAIENSYRVDVFKYADFFEVIPCRELIGDVEYIQKYLEYIAEHNINVVMVGDHRQLFEEFRTRFESLGVILFNGLVGLEIHKSVQQKSEFISICESNGIAVLPGHLFSSQIEFEALYSAMKKEHSCLYVEPADTCTQGAVIKLDERVSLFEALSLKSVVNPSDFAESYGKHSEKPNYLIRPLGTDGECYVDAACFKGEILLGIARSNLGDLTCLIEVDHPSIKVATQLIEQFQCDGLISLKFVQDKLGAWVVSDIDFQTNGSMFYAVASGFNLVGLLLARVADELDQKTFMNGRKWKQNKAVVKISTTADLID